MVPTSGIQIEVLLALIHRLASSRVKQVPILPLWAGIIHYILVALLPRRYPPPVYLVQIPQLREHSLSLLRVRIMGLTGSWQMPLQLLIYLQLLWRKFILTNMGSVSRRRMQVFSAYA